MRFIFLKNVYAVTKGNNFTLYPSVVYSDENSFSYTSKVLTLDELEAICQEYEHNDDLEIDFYYSKEDGFETHDAPCINVTEDAIQNLLNSPVDYKPVSDKTIYHLLLDLCKDKALFVPDFYVDGSNSSSVEISKLPDFIPKVSQTTLTVYISYVIDNRWVSKKILNSVEGQLVSEEFSFAIRTDLVKNYSKYGLEVDSTLNISGIDYTIMTYKRNLPIFMYSETSIPYFKPYIVRYVAKRTAENYVIKTFRMIIKSFMKDEKIYDEGERKPPVHRRIVSFKLLEEALTEQDLMELIINMTKTIIPMLNKGEISLEDINSQIIKNDDLNYMKRCVYASLLEVLYHQTTPLIPTLVSAIKECEKEKLRYDLVVYTIRIALAEVGALRDETFEGSDLGYMVKSIYRK